MPLKADSAGTNAEQVARVEGSAVAVRGNDIDTDRISING